jgi:hypothetical protein
MQSNAWPRQPMPQGSKAEFFRGSSRFEFLNCGGNGPNDILKFP